jgi:hypothetical protein
MFKKYLFVPIVAVMLTTLFPLSTYAAEFKTGNYTLETESVVDDDLYIAGENVVIEGVVDGDLVVFGDEITVNGTVSGDLYVFGATIDIAGSVYGSVFAFGSNVTVEGTVGSNMYIGSMIADLDADIAKDLNIGAGTVKLAGSVGDDVRVATGQLSSEAVVTGDFLASTESPSVNEEKISGEYILSSIPDNRDQPTFEFNADNLRGFNLGLTIIGFVGMYIVGLLLIYAAPVKTVTIGKKITESFSEFLKSFAIGLVILLAIPVPIFILTMTLVGAPLAILLTAILIFLVTFGTLWSETAIGFKVLSLVKYKDNQRFLSLLIGRLISVILRFIPFVGPIYTMILSTTTVGAVVRAKYDMFQTKGKK